MTTLIICLGFAFFFYVVSAEIDRQVDEKIDERLSDIHGEWEDDDDQDYHSF